MSNKVIIAAAGSGKTTHLVKEALRLQGVQILITTYTEENEKEIRKKFVELNKCVPANVKIQTWFSFLLQHGVKPYQSYLYSDKISGLYLYNGISAKGTKETDVARHYLTTDGKIYSDKIAKFVCRCDEKSKGTVIKRITNIYSHIFIDEVQDLAGYDLDFLNKLCPTSLEIILVGDPRQGTFSTNNSSKNKKYQRSNILLYFDSIRKKFNLEIDSTSLNINHRCVSAICDFSNKLYPDMSATISDNTDDVEHKGVFLIRPFDVDDYLSKYQPVQLRYNIKTRTNDSCPTLNFGASKGLSFDRILIYPTQAILDWLIGNKPLAATSKCKLYVAITRARYSVAIIYNYDEELNIDGILKYK